MNKAPETDAFNSRTQKRPSGCIEWAGPRDPKGYGRFTFKGKQRLAHRAAWQLFCGDLSPDACVLHRCDNPPCVNPAHLFLGDRGDNARDMASKGRQWVQKNPAGRPICPIELKPRGAAHGCARLSEAQVIEIRTRASEGESGRQLAKAFTCSASLVSQIIRGTIWTHLGGPIKNVQLTGDSNE